MGSALFGVGIALSAEGDGLASPEGGGLAPAGGGGGVVPAGGVLVSPGQGAKLQSGPLRETEEPSGQIFASIEQAIGCAGATRMASLAQAGRGAASMRGRIRKKNAGRIVIGLCE
jgi:hypothetical protein